MLPALQDELSLRFFNFNHQQCLLNQLRNYWHKAVFPAGQLPPKLWGKDSSGPPRRANYPRHPFSSLGNFPAFDQNHLFWSFISVSEFWEALGLGTEKNGFVYVAQSSTCRIVLGRESWQWSKPEKWYYSYRCHCLSFKEKTKKKEQAEMAFES